MNLRMKILLRPGIWVSLVAASTTDPMGKFTVHQRSLGHHHAEKDCSWIVAKWLHYGDVRPRNWAPFPKGRACNRFKASCDSNASPSRSSSSYSKDMPHRISEN